MVAMPFHPSNVYTVRELNENLSDIIGEVEKKGAKQLESPDVTFSLKNNIAKAGLILDQGIIAGCAGGTFENISDAADILESAANGCGSFDLNIYPASSPVLYAAIATGSISVLMAAGANIRSAFCGPCFGAGDVPPHNSFSIRHTTRNFPNREGSKPGDGQIASVALMDARSIAATARNGGKITAATEIDVKYGKYKFFFDKSIYDKRVYNGIGKPQPQTELVFGPNIKDWPKMPALPENLLIKVVSYITDPVTTTDELIPSGETSSYRSNPLKLAEFTLSRKDPDYVKKLGLRGNAMQTSMPKGVFVCLACL